MPKTYTKEELIKAIEKVKMDQLKCLVEDIAEIDSKDITEFLRGYEMGWKVSLNCFVVFLCWELGIDINGVAKEIKK